jgi:dihydrofolate reductase
MEISIVVAFANNQVIGNKGKIPWFGLDEWADARKADMKRFRELTIPHSVIMGRKTYESLGKPLPQRANIVISSRELEVPEGVIVTHSPLKAAQLAFDKDKQIAFVVGGEQVYKYFLQYTASMHITRINGDFEGDAHFPEFNEREWQETRKQDFGRYSFIDYVRI